MEYTAQDNIYNKVFVHMYVHAQIVKAETILFHCPYVMSYLKPASYSPYLIMYTLQAYRQGNGTFIFSNIISLGNIHNQMSNVCQ